MRAFAEMLLVRVAVLAVASAVSLGTVGVLASRSPDRGAVAIHHEETAVPAQVYDAPDPSGTGASAYLSYLVRHLGWLAVDSQAATVLANGEAACAYMRSGHTAGQTAAWMLAVTHASDWDSPYTVAQSYGANRYLCP